MQKINLFLIGLIFIIPLKIKAQDFEVAPVKMNFRVDPEESQTKILSVKNHSNFRTSFTISFADFIIDKNGNKQAIEKNSSKTSCTEWITPEKTFFDINPNEQVLIKITMHPPIDDYTTRWALMYIQTVNEKTSFDVEEGVGAGVRLSGRIAVSIYRDPIVRLTPKLKIKDLREISDADSTHRYFITDIINVGKNIAKCKVMFIASDLNTAEEFDFDPVYLDSYPGFLRQVKFKLPNTLPPGKYSFAVLLDYGKDVTIEGTRLNKTLIILPKEGSNIENNKNKK